MSETADASNGDLESSSMFTIKWKVKAFTAYFDSDDNDLQSPELLTVYANNVMHWKLRLSKNYDREGYRNYMAIYLDYLDEFPMTASVSFAIISSRREQTRVFQRVTKAKFDKNLHFCGIIDFVLQHLIVDGNMNILVNDSLIITCEIRFQDSLLCTKLSQLVDKKNPGAAESAPVTSSSSSSSVCDAGKPLSTCADLALLSDDLEKLFESDKYTDVSFIIGENTIRAHKNVLIARSLVFQKMFAAHAENAERKRSLVAVKDVRFDVMKEVLRFLYAAKVNEAGKMTSELLMASEKYAIPGLKAACEKILGDNLKYENALDYLSLAKTYKATKLHTKVMDFVIKRLADYVSTAEFRELTVDIKDDLLNAVSKRNIPS